MGKETRLHCVQVHSRAYNIAHWNNIKIHLKTNKSFLSSQENSIDKHQCLVPMFIFFTYFWPDVHAKNSAEIWK